MKTIASKCTDEHLNETVSQLVFGRPSQCVCGKDKEQHDSGKITHRYVPAALPYAADLNCIIQIISKRQVSLSLAFDAVTLIWSVEIAGDNRSWTAQSKELSRAACFAYLAAMGFEIAG